MDVGEEQSARYIEELAQAVPFKFVDRVRFLDDSRVVTELHGRGLPYRFADAAQVDMYAILEFAAQSSGLILRGRKQGGRRGVISSFEGVERKTHGALHFPIRLESQLMSQQLSFFTFDFKVHSDAELVVVGSIRIFIGGEMERIDIDLYLRQTAPFRFVDEVFFSDETDVIRASRRYIGDEQFFAGHFPGDPVVPGVILVESMAQSCRAWLNRKLGKKADGFIASIDRAKFIKPVRPGDIVVMESKPLAPVSDGGDSSFRFCRFSCVSRCGDDDVAKASVTLYQSIA